MSYICTNLCLSVPNLSQISHVCIYKQKQLRHLYRLGLSLNIAIPKQNVLPSVLETYIILKLVRREQE
jgi:hypothetical protein